MSDSGLDYLLQFSKIKKNEKIGDIEAINFEATGDESQMGQLIVHCSCSKHKKHFKIPASVLNWKITKFQKGGLDSLNYKSICTTISE